MEDIPALTMAMLEKINRRLGCKVTGLDGGLMDFLKRYPWPGNVRELQNVLESMAAITKAGQVRGRTVGYVLEELEERKRAAGQDRNVTLEDWERGAIREALAAEQGNRSRAAERLGIDRGTLLHKLQKYGLK